MLIYPHAFQVDIEHTDDIGLVQSGRDWRAGESWQEGQVILSWEDVLEGAADPHDGWNVVIHEFAHQLDAETGANDGTPSLPSPSRRACWSAVLQSAFDELRTAVQRGEENTFLDPYGASDPVEFFAVSTECFFEQGPELRANHPDLYNELQALYQVDTSAWLPAPKSIRAKRQPDQASYLA